MELKRLYNNITVVLPVISIQEEQEVKTTLINGNIFTGEFIKVPCQQTRSCTCLLWQQFYRPISMRCGNIASHTNRAECIYGIHTYHINIYIYTCRYRQFTIFITSVGLTVLAPINSKKNNIHHFPKMSSSSHFSPKKQGKQC